MAGDAVPELVPTATGHGRLVAPRARQALVRFTDRSWRLCQVTGWCQLSRYRWNIQLAAGDQPPQWYDYDPGCIRPPRRVREGGRSGAAGGRCPRTGYRDGMSG